VSRGAAKFAYFDIALAPYKAGALINYLCRVHPLFSADTLVLLSMAKGRVW
jgi:hypothetical protein